MNYPWPAVPLGEVLTERQEVPRQDALASGEVRIVAKIGFNDGEIQLRSDGDTRTNMILIRPGDLVLSGINAAKGAIAVYKRENKSPIAATIHYAAYEVNEERADIGYLWWLLRSQTFRDILFQNVPGGIKTELKAKRLLPIPVPLPPLPEQRRIVAKIKAMYAKIGEAKGQRSSASQLAASIIKTRIQDTVEHVEATGKLGAVLTGKPRNGWSARCDNAEDGTPVLSLGAVTGFHYRQTEFKRTSLNSQPEAHFWLKGGDLLITRSNTPELVGHAAIFNGTPFPCIYPDLMMRVDVDDKYADPKFVWYWLQSHVVRQFIQKEAKGTSPTMKKISQGTVMQIPFPEGLLLNEQRRIVAYLDGLQAQVDALKKLQTQTAAELDALLPSILDRTFKGEL
jgi:type I restriction enzyme S subunit